MKIAVSFKLFLDSFLLFSIYADGQKYYLIGGKDQLSIEKAFILLKRNHIQDNKFFSLEDEVLVQAFLY